MSANQSIPSDPAAIERAIRDRQSSLASTVDELVERVQPKNLAEAAKQGAKDRAMTFLGIAKEKGRDASDTAKGKLNDATSTVKDKASGAGHAVSDRAHSVTSAGSGTASNFVHSAQGSAKQAVNTARSGLTDEAGNPDQARVAAVAAGTASAILFVSWLASRGR